jgi:hypothetical protein
MSFDQRLSVDRAPVGTLGVVGTAHQPHDAY